MKSFIPIISFLCFAVSGFTQMTNIDTLFGTDGIVITQYGNSPSGPYDSYIDVFIQPDGKMITTGYAINDGVGNYEPSVLISKHLELGELDFDFGINGAAYFLQAENSSGGRAGLILPDSKILLSGTTDWSIAGWGNGSYSTLVRTHSDGSLDSSFATNGIKILYNQDYATSLKIHDNNKILAGGITVKKNETSPTEYYYKYSLNVVRLFEDGSVDSIFGNNGISEIVNITGPESLYPADMVVQSDGRIVICGYSYGSSTDIVIGRLNIDGSIDNSFGSNGVLFIDFGGSERSTAMTILPNDKMLICGFTEEGNGLITKLNTDGTFDSSFGDGGKILVVGGNKDIVFNDIELLENEKIIVAGYTGKDKTDFLLAKFSQSGDEEVIAINDFGSDTEAWEALKIQDNGKVVTAGRIWHEGRQKCAIARYIPDLMVGTFEPENEPSISTLIYPNPVSDFVTLEYLLESETEISISLFDRNGSLMKSYFDKSKRPAGPQKEILEIEDHFPAGNYFLKITAGKNIKSVWLSIL